MPNVIGEYDCRSHPNERGAVLIQSVDRAVRMLLELQGARHLALSELAARLDMSPSTVHGLIKTLAVHDLVRQDAQTQRYYLGPTVLRLAGVYLEGLDLRTRALPWTKDLVTKTGCSVRIGVRSGREVIVVHHETAPGRHSHMAELGVGIPVHASSMGKAMLAFESASVIDEWVDPLPAMTSSTVTSISVLRKELATIRKKGVAFEREESLIGESTVAAPLIGAGARVLGAISVVTGAASEAELQTLVNPTIDIARAISRELGGGATITR
jgi:DNA-binding IclR family transcriptional regulator